MSSSPEADITCARNLGWTLLEKLAAIDVARRSPVVVRPDGSQMDRREFLHGQSTRFLLEQLDADVDRLQAAAAGCRQRAGEHLETEGPCLAQEMFEAGADLADTAADLVRATGMPADASRAARDAVLAEMLCWSSEQTGWHSPGRRARRRRRLRLALDALRRP